MFQTKLPNIIIYYQNYTFSTIIIIIAITINISNNHNNDFHSYFWQQYVYLSKILKGLTEKMSDFVITQQTPDISWIAHVVKGHYITVKVMLIFLNLSISHRLVHRKSETVPRISVIFIYFFLHFFHPFTLKMPHWDGLGLTISKWDTLFRLFHLMGQINLPGGRMVNFCPRVPLKCLIQSWHLI